MSGFSRCLIMSGVHPMERRCFVHIGPPKTGTSYLQSVLWASRDALADQGLDLPLEMRDHYHLALALRHMVSDETAPAGVSTVLDRLAAATSAIRDSNALLTQEQLAPATPAQAQQLTNLLSGWEVHVVITARDLGRQVPSAWQQSIKKRQTHSYDEFLQAVVERRPAASDFWSHQDLVEVAARWSTAVPAHRVHIVIVPPSGSPAGWLLERFCSVLGVDPTLLQVNAAVSNTSLGRVQAELLRKVNEILADDLSEPALPAARAGQNYLAKQVLAPQAGRPPQLPSRLHDWCRQVSEQAIGEIRARGYDVIGDIAELMPSFPDSPDRDNLVSEAEINATAAQALATTVTRRYDDVERLRRLRERLRKQADRLDRLERRSRAVRRQN